MCSAVLSDGDYFIPSSQLRKLSTERLSNSPQVTQLVGSEAGLAMKSGLFQSW